MNAGQQTTMSPKPTQRRKTKLRTPKRKEGGTQLVTGKLCCYVIKTTQETARLGSVVTASQLEALTLMITEHRNTPITRKEYMMKHKARADNKQGERESTNEIGKQQEKDHTQCGAMRKPSLDRQRRTAE